MGDASQTPTPENRCFLQAFEWNVPADQKHWKRLRAVLPDLKSIGVDAMWIPPACKGAGGGEANGYDIYDLYDLGEFDQKGSKSTKWGPREELMELVNAAKDTQMGVYFDAVLNHKAGADNKEKCQVIEVDSSDRTKDVGEQHEIEAWLGFEFPGRGDKYSAMKWHWEHFSGTDYDAGNDRTAIFRIVGDNKHWSRSVDDQDGNADFLMFADVDFAHPEVCKDVINWGEWVVKECKLGGFRFDAVQHFSQRFLNEFIQMLEEKFGKDQLFLVGEFWQGEVASLTGYLEEMNHKFSLFDAPLLYNFSKLSTTERADLRTVFDGSLVKEKPVNAVTLVMNHDTQPGQTVETPIEGFFKPLAYALILLRSEGYPQLFYGDLYGMKKNNEPPACGGKLPDLTLARKLYAYGAQEDYFDDPNCIGFVRRGTWDKPVGLACVMSNAGPGQKRMAVGEMHAGQVWTDILGFEEKDVQIDNDGYGMFPCPGTSISVYVRRDAEGRDQFGKFDVDIYGKV